jgi:PAS domain S-box-containing protein
VVQWHGFPAWRTAVVGAAVFVLLAAGGWLCVLPVIKAIPGWAPLLLARIDLAGVIGGLLISAAVAAVGWAWQRHAKARYQALIRAELARRETETRYGITLRSIGDGVIVVDAQGQVELLNPMAEQLTGWRDGEARGRPLEEVFRVIDEQTRQPAENPARRVLLEGTVAGRAGHSVLIARDGTERPIANRGAPIRSEGGEISGAVLVFCDQSEERATQRALAASEERFRAIASLTPDLVMVQDRELRYTLVVNPPWGLTEQYMIGKTDEDLPSKEDGKRLMSIKRLVLETGTPVQVELPLMSPQGERDFFSGSYVPKRNAQGQVDGLIGYFRNVTERKQIEDQLVAAKDQLEARVEQRTAALAERTAELEREMLQRQSVIKELTITERTMQREIAFSRAIIERANDGLCVFHETADVPPVRVFTVWNDRMTEITGYTMEEINRRGWYQTVYPDPEVAERVRQRVVAARAGRDARSEEWVITRADGAQRTLLISTKVLPAAEGPPQVLATMNDISEQRAAERELQQSMRAQFEAEKLAATGRLAARVAHEINNPLAGIKNAFRIFQRVIPKDCPEYAYVARTEAELGRVVRIVRQMYELHRPAQGQTVEVRLDYECREVHSLLETVLRQKDLDLELREPLPDVRVRLPEGAVRQILMNLVSNAMDASPDGGTVTIGLTADQHRAAISVSDRGAGMSEPVRARIFEPFFTTKADAGSAGGLGLGLSISKQLAESFGGVLDCESTLGQGSVFRLIIPLDPNTTEDTT